MTGERAVGWSYMTRAVMRTGWVRLNLDLSLFC